MDIEDYYFRTKNNKQRKFEGSCKRKGQTIRQAENGRKGQRAQELVAKTVVTTENWDEDRLKDYCDNVLEDGGMPLQYVDYWSSGVSMKKQKRWKLSGKIRNAMFGEIEDVEAPNVSLVERVVGCKDSRTTKGNVTRATYITTKPTSNSTRSSKKTDDGCERRIVDRTPNGKHNYSYTEDLTGYRHPGRQRYDKETDEKQRPTIAYEFLYSCPPDRCPGDGSSGKPWSYKYNSKKGSYFDQIEEYYYEQNHDDGLCSDEDAVQSLDGDIESEDAEKERNSEITFDSLIQTFIYNSVKNKRKRNNRRAKRSCVVAANEGHKTMKGKVVKVDESENQFPATQETDQKANPLFSLKIENRDLEKFISASNEQSTTNFVEFANLRPIVFTADLRPEPDNGIRSGPCHLVFQTDVDPDVFEGEGLTKEFDFHKIDIFLFCDDKEFYNLLSNNLQEAVESAQCAEEESYLEVTILCARKIAEEHWTARSDATQNAPDISMELKTDPKRITHVIKNMTEHLGLASKYCTLEELRTDHAQEDSGFEMVTDSSPGESCRLCGVHFDSDNRGLSLHLCRHWFCQKCWTSHMTKTKEFFPKCIEEYCKTPINEAAKTALCSLAGRSELFLASGKIGSNIAYKCPLSTCSGVTMIRDSEHLSSMLSCGCGMTWCQDCGDVPHWPASCQASKLFSTERKLWKRKSLFDFWKPCFTCGKLLPYPKPRSYGFCPECGDKFNCWHCMGVHFSRLGRFRHAQRRDPNATKHVHAIVPAQGTFLSGEFQFDKEIAEAHQKTVKKHNDSFLNNEIANQARSRAADYLAKENNLEMLTVIEDLLLVKNQLHYVIPHIIASLSYGDTHKRPSKYVKGIVNKMEMVIERMEYLLLKRDYKSRDSVFPTTYQAVAVKGRSLIKDVFRTHQSCK